VSRTKSEKFITYPLRCKERATARPTGQRLRIPPRVIKSFEGLVLIVGQSSRGVIWHLTAPVLAGDLADGGAATGWGELHSPAVMGRYLTRSVSHQIYSEVVKTSLK
jgi:hypothetical protein